MPRNFVKHTHYTRRNPHNVPSIIVKEAGRLFRAGNTLTSIAEVLKINRLTVHRWARKYGWERSKAPPS